MKQRCTDELTAVYRDGLIEEVVPFWIEHSVDREYGGFATYVDADGSRVSWDKSIWIQGRFTWLLARLCNEVAQRAEWLDLSRHGVEFILKHAFDRDVSFETAPCCAEAGTFSTVSAAAARQTAGSMVSFLRAQSAAAGTFLSGTV